MCVRCRGVLFVDVRQCDELPSGDYHGGSSDPYVLLKVAGQKQQTVVYPHTTSPVYNAHFEFFNVQAQDVLQIQVSMIIYSSISSVSSEPHTDYDVNQKS